MRRAAQSLLLGFSSLAQEVIEQRPSRQAALPPHRVRSRHTQEEVRAALRVRLRGGRGGSELEDLAEAPVVGSAVGARGRHRREAFGREVQHTRVAACSGGGKEGGVGGDGGG